MNRKPKDVYIIAFAMFVCVFQTVADLHFPTVLHRKWKLLNLFMYFVKSGSSAAVVGSSILATSGQPWSFIADRKPDDHDLAVIQLSLWVKWLGGGCLWAVKSRSACQWLCMKLREILWLCTLFYFASLANCDPLNPYCNSEKTRR